MFINFWYPTVLASELADQPVQVRVLGQALAVFRDSQGRAHCLSNVCPHRGGSLAGGRVRGDRLQCPYHGWEFTGGGACGRIPSLGPDGKIPARAGVDSYPVLEKYGIVFAFLGDLPEGERPPLLEIPEFGREGWRASWLTYDVDYNYERSIENGLDPAHNEFVHPSHGYSGEREGYKVNDLRWVGSGEWGPGFFHVFRSPPSTDADFARMKQASDSREAGTGCIGPNQVWTYIRFGAGKNMHQYMYEAPIDETRTRIFLVNLRSTFLEPEMDQKVNEMNWKIASQDITVLKDLAPALTPETSTKEFMVPADEPILRYRKKLGEWTARGWRVDTETVNRLRKRTAWAIPSPERRLRKGWVLDPLPLVAASGAAADGLAAGQAAQG